MKPMRPPEPRGGAAPGRAPADMPSLRVAARTVHSGKPGIRAGKVRPRLAASRAMVWWEKSHRGPTMATVQVGAKGRVPIPQPLRRRLHMRPGTTMHVRVLGDALELRAEPEPMG